jgi:hypothetical protein
MKAADTALYPDQLIPAEKAYLRVEVVRPVLVETDDRQVWTGGQYVDLCGNHYKRYEAEFVKAGYRIRDERPASWRDNSGGTGGT